MTEIPGEIRRGVIAEVYRRADQVDWETLPAVERTALYNQWVDDECIGGVLAGFLGRDRLRGWLKDCAIKEYARARSGVGPNASLVTMRWPGPSEIAAQVLGPDWAILVESIKSKPMRCVVSNERVQRTLLWGPARSFRDLMWAALNTCLDGEPCPVAVVTLPQGERLAPRDSDRHLAIASRLDIDVRHVPIRLVHVQREMS